MNFHVAPFQSTTLSLNSGQLELNTQHLILNFQCDAYFTVFRSPERTLFH